VFGARGRRIVVELCMKEELMAGQRHLGRLVRAYLPDAGVSSVGPPGALALAAGAITVLDLQARAQPAAVRKLSALRLLHAAASPPGGAAARLARRCSPQRGAARVASAQPEARPTRCAAPWSARAACADCVRCSRVPNVLPEGPAAGVPFARLRTLVLNASGATWQTVRFALTSGMPISRIRASQVCRLQPLLPALVELHMCDCGMSSLSADGAPVTARASSGFLTNPSDTGAPQPRCGRSCACST